MRVRAHSAILDGEICCLEPDGRSNFQKLIFRREWPHFYAFDLLSADGEDLRALSLLERKRRLLPVSEDASGAPLSGDRQRRRAVLSIPDRAVRFCGRVAVQRDVTAVKPM